MADTPAPKKQEPPKPEPTKTEPIDESDHTALWRAAIARWTGGSIVRSLLPQLHLTGLTKTHAELTPAPSIRTLAEARLPECSVLLSQVLGRSITCVLSDPPKPGDDAPKPADAGPIFHPSSDEPPDDHPLVVAVKDIFNAELRDKIAKQAAPTTPDQPET